MGRGEPERDSFEVFLDAAQLGARQRVGVLYRSAERTDLPASFEYDERWLENPGVFMLDPRLELWRGEQHPPSKTSAFGIFLDSAPDRWGRLLMERREAAQALREHRRVRSLQELDFLLGVHDLTRLGALRFRSVRGGPFLDDSDDAVPPVTNLRELAAIVKRIEEPGVEKLPSYEQWLAMLIAPGTSLGGSRPKVNFLDQHQAMWIAKFPARDDRHDVGTWEFIVHSLADKAGISVPQSRVEQLTDKFGTFCVSRFDRVGSDRRMFASATALLERQDGDKSASYLDLAEFISDQGASGHIAEDLAQLFRRVVFNVVVGNRDDHLRNHGFIRETTGWRLAPAYDMNPNPYRIEHSLTLDGVAATPDLMIVLESADYYRLERTQAQAVVDEVKSVVTTWRDVATAHGIPRQERAMMENVFLV
jgi:serine/threonine-protein kinase HipA